MRNMDNKKQSFQKHRLNAQLSHGNMYGSFIKASGLPPVKKDRSNFFFEEPAKRKLTRLVKRFGLKFDMPCWFLLTRHNKLILTRQIFCPAPGQLPAKLSYQARTKPICNISCVGLKFVGNQNMWCMALKITRRITCHHHHHQVEQKEPLLHDH